MNTSKIDKNESAWTKGNIFHVSLNIVTFLRISYEAYKQDSIIIYRLLKNTIIIHDDNNENESTPLKVSKNSLVNRLKK